MVVRTLLEVFPSATLWQPSRGEFVFVGQMQSLILDASRLDSRVQHSPTIREDFASMGYAQPLTILTDFLLTSDDLRRYAGEGALNTDDLPLLEFTAPRGLFLETERTNDDLVRSFRTREFPPLAHVPGGALEAPELRAAMGRLSLRQSRLDDALRQFELTLGSNPRFIPALLGRADVLARSGQVLRARTDLEAVLRLEPGNAAAHLALARLYKGQGLLGETRDQLRAVVRSDGPLVSEALTLLGELSLQAGSAAEARGHLQRAVVLRPEDAGSWSLLGLALEQEGQLSEAIRAHRRAAGLDEYASNFRTRLARTLREAKLLDDALREGERAVASNPLLVEPYLELASIHTARQDNGAATATLERALQADPNNVRARRELERVREMKDSRS
jgi:tetratricopeptide (TPR) repeat protein